MIPVFHKLKTEKLLVNNGSLLDLGCGNGKFSEPFFQFGYKVELVDKDENILLQAKQTLENFKKGGFEIINSPIENFEFNKKYNGIIISNVLPFQNKKENIESIILSAYNNLEPGGFLFFTLFGDKDQWSLEKRESMSFYTKDEASNILKKSLYFISEDYGKGSTMKGDIKTWHIFSFLYIK